MRDRVDPAFAFLARAGRRALFAVSSASPTALEPAKLVAHAAQLVEPPVDVRPDVG
jgi:hypothetical protein